MKEVIGRAAEMQILNSVLTSKEAELVAVYGRRRVGKTFLIKNACKQHIIFEFSGAYNLSAKTQLQNFNWALQQHFPTAGPIGKISNWSEAFHFLKQLLTPPLGEVKQVIFLDEFPWLDTRKSGFLSAFEYFWNSWAANQPNLVVIICGSAASWMIKNVVNNKGGLHNRITRKIRLLPFTLQETEAFLTSRSINLSRLDVLKLYMAMGGIPQYLKSIERGESVAQAVDRACFTKDGMLRDEFKNLYQSLFDKADQHIAVVKALASKGKGLSRNEIIKECNLSSGGTVTRLLTELEESGFIFSYIPVNKTSKDKVYKLGDEYSLFFLKFIESTRPSSSDTWLLLSETPSWKSWSGVAFEGICIKHIRQLKKALGIAAVFTTESVWRHVPGKGKPGAQIDLVIDRMDRTINLCEMKFSTTEFVLSKECADELRKKRDVFKMETGTKKNLFITMITTYGVKPGAHSGIVDKQLTMDALFD